MPAPGRPKMVYHFIKPGGSIKQELLARQRSSTATTEPTKKETSGSSLWQKASALRQSLRSNKKSRQEEPHHVRSYSDYGDGRLTDTSGPPMWEQHPPRHPSKTRRKLTRDSGYETSSGQIDPDYVNSDWLSDHWTDSSESYKPSLDKRHNRKREETRYISRSQSYGRDTCKAKITCIKSTLPDLPYHPFSRYSSTESLSSCWSNCTAVEDEHPVYPARSVPDLDQVGDMVTRKFKKGSVYEALASKSGLDFAPVIQGRPYWERREHVEGEEYARKIVHGKNAETLRNNTNSHQEPEKLSKKTHSYISPKYQQGDENQTPPPPPVRDSSSLKYVRQHPHEKYPSWPATPVTEASSSAGSCVSPSKTSSGSASSHRSNSWTEHTDYPKERVDYCRPKKGYKISPHHLQPVLEKSVLDGGGSRRSKSDQSVALESTLKIALETSTETIDLDSLCRSTYYPRHSSTSRDYKIHSPPERDVPRPQPRERQPKLLENGQQCYWSNSHESCTPLMDRLRMESEAMPQTTWSPQLDLETPSEAGNESVDSSNSSQETLKWHGSCSDLSCSNRSSVFDSGRSTLPDRLSPHSCDSNSHVVHSSRVEPAQRHDSESVLYYTSLTRSSNRSDDKRNFSTSFPGFSRNSCEPAYYPNAENVAKMKITDRSPDAARCKQEIEIVESKQKYHYLDPEKKHRISDPELKAIQKQAVLSFYHRQTAANLANSTGSLSPHESPPISPGKAKWNQWDAGRLDKVPEHSILATDVTPRSSVRSKVIEGNKSFESQLSWSVPNLTELSPPPYQVSSHPSQRESGPGSLPYMEESGTVHNVQEHKECPPDTSNSCQHQRLQNHNQPRKGHLKEVHNCNDKSVVQVITTNGVTIAETLKTNGAPKNKVSEYPVIPPKRINKPVPQPPQQQLSARRPPPPIPSEENEEHDEEDMELKTIEESSKRLSRLPNTAVYHETSSREASLESTTISNCSSPDLPLPPPPSTNEIEVHYSDEPLPPPPELEVLSSLKMSAGFKNTKITKNNRSSSQGEKSTSPNYKSPHLLQDNVPTSENISESSPKQSEIVSSKVHATEQSTDFSTRIVSCANLDSPSLDNDDSNVNVPPLYKRSEDNPVLDSCSPQSPVASCNPSFARCSVDKGSPGDHSSSCTVDKPSKEDPFEKQTVSVDLNLNPDPVINREQQSAAINSINDTHVNVCVTNSATQTMDTPRLSKKILKSKEELECEKLSRDFVDSCGDMLLKNLLVPAPNQKTMMDYMKGLLDLDTEENSQTIHRNHHYKLPQNRPNNNCSLKTSINGWREGAGLPPHSAYFTISEPKAKLLTRYCQDIKRQDWANEAELNKKKDELIASITRKLEILRTEQIAIREEVAQNELLGQEVTTKVECLAKSNEVEKYKLHVEELEKIVNLLLSLSGRLARAQNALMNLTKEASKEERMILEAKRDKLSEQHEEARLLKDSIDRRSQQVSTFLHKYLTDEEYADYDHFVKMKSKLLLDAREIDEKIKLGEEQLSALRNSMDSHLWTHLQSKSDSPAGQVQLCRT